MPAAVDKVGGGYVGAQLAPQGHALRRNPAPVRPQVGDLAIVIPGSNDEPATCAKKALPRRLRKAGSKSSGWPASRNGPPTRTRHTRHHRELSGQSNGQGDRLSRRPAARQRGDLHEGCGKKPGEVFNVGFDTSPQIVEAFKSGRQLTPTSNRSSRAIFRSEPLRADRVRPCPDQRRHRRLRDPENYKAVADLATQWSAAYPPVPGAIRGRAGTGVGRNRRRWANG